MPEPLTKAEFAEQRLNIQMWPKLKMVYDLIDMGVSKILIRSANGIGKSTLLASIVVMEMQRDEDTQVVCTGATYTQLKETLWRATKRIARTSNLSVENFKAFTWETDERHRAIAISPAKVESGQGFHAERVVILVDEATGTPQDRLNALYSNATGTSHLFILTYNPINPDAACYELEQGATPIEALLDEDGQLSTDRVKDIAQSSEWVSIGISAFDHPNVISGHEVIKGAVTRQFVESRLRMDSVECHPLETGAIVVPWTGKAYLPTAEAMARVCGAWSQTMSIGFISGAVVVGSWSVEPAVGLKIAGADIGGGGEDPSVWTHFDGNGQYPFQSLKTGELGVVASQLNKYCLEYEIDALCIDDTGVGHGVTDRLQEIKPKYKLIPVNFGSAAKNFPEVAIRKPANARCEMYLLLEKEMRSKEIRITYDKELQRELCSQKIEGFGKSEQIRLEDKRLIHRRIGRSPNKADATALARYGRRLLDHYNRPLMY